MKVFRIIVAAFTSLLGIFMICIAYYFFFNEEDAIVCLSSLYVALFISVIVLTAGISLFFWVKKDNKIKEKNDESNND